MVSSLRAPALTCLAAVLAVSVACGGSSGGDEPTVGPLERMLQVIPDTEVNRRSILIHDYARIRELNGMPIPSAAPDQESIITYLLKLARPDPDSNEDRIAIEPPLISIGVPSGQAFLLPETIGYSFFDVDQDITVGIPPNVSAATHGRIDTDLVNATVRKCEVCPTPDEPTHSGVSFFSWGEDMEMKFETIFSPPAFDNLGRGGRIAAVDGFVMRSLWTEGIEGMIDAQQGEGSLADNADIVAAFRELDERRAFAAYGTDETRSVAFVTSTFDLDQLPDGVVWPPSEDEPLLRPYRFVALGAGHDDEGQFFWLVLVHESSAEALDNERILPLRVRDTKSFRGGQPWAEILTVEELEASGRLLVAKIRGVSFPYAHHIFTLESLLVHENPE